MKFHFLPLLLGMLFLACLHAHAWAPATHAYLAARFTGSQSNGIVYGAMAPDFGALIPDNPAARSTLSHLTHVEFGLLTPSDFATGFSTHNGVWGADYYAHLYYTPEADPIYSTLKIQQISTEFGLTMLKAEDVFEMTIDFLIRLAVGPELGTRMKNSVSAANEVNTQALVDAFAQSLSDGAGITLTEAQEAIQNAVAMHKTMTEAYGAQWEQDETYLRSVIPTLLAGYLGVEEETAETYFLRAIEICSDFQTEMDRIVGIVSAHYPQSEGEGTSEGEGMTEGESEGEGEPNPWDMDFCAQFQGIVDNPLMDMAGPEFQVFVEMLYPNNADINGSFAVDTTNGNDIQITGNGILDAMNEFGLIERILEDPNFNNGVFSSAALRTAWTANLTQLQTDFGPLATSVLNVLAPQLFVVFNAYLILGDGDYAILSKPTQEEPNLPFVASGNGSFGLIGGLVALLAGMSSEYIPGGIAHPELNKTQYLNFPELLPDGDADGDGFSNAMEYAYFAPVVCNTSELKSDPAISYVIAALNPYIIPLPNEGLDEGEEEGLPTEGQTEGVTEGEIIGTCCVGGICYNVTQSECLSVCGNYGAGYSCEYETCPDIEGEVTGACCKDGYCANMRDCDCFNSGGTYLGYYTSCEYESCQDLFEGEYDGEDDATGACCVDWDCIDMTYADCLSYDGNYRGDYSSCEYESCPDVFEGEYDGEEVTGACCVGEVCYGMTYWECLYYYGTYYGDYTFCDFEYCPDIVEGEAEGEGETGIHTADQNHDNQINVSELLRVIQFFNSGGFHCQSGTEDGYAPGPDKGWPPLVPKADCASHASDYNPQDWHINLSELLRLIQFFNSGGYHACEGSEDGFCPGI